MLYTRDEWNEMSGLEQLGTLLGGFIGLAAKTFLMAIIFCAVARHMFGF